MMLGWNRVTACVRRSRSTVSAWQVTAQYVGGHARRFSSAATSDRDSVSADDTAGKSESRKEEDALATEIREEEDALATEVREEEDALATEATGEIKPSDSALHGLIASSEDLADVLRRCRPLGDKLMTCAALRSEQAFFLAFRTALSAARAKNQLARHFQISDVADDDPRAESSMRLMRVGFLSDGKRSVKHVTESVMLGADDFFSAVDSDTDFCRRIDYITFSKKKKTRVFFTDVRSAVEALCRLKPSVLKSRPEFFRSLFMKDARNDRRAEMQKRYEVPYPTPRLMVKSTSMLEVQERLTMWKQHILMIFPLWNEALVYLLFTDSAAAFQASRSLPPGLDYFFVAEPPAEQALREEENLVMLEKKLLSDERSVFLEACDEDRNAYPQRTNEPAVHGPLLIVNGLSESEAKSLAVASGLSDHDLLLVHSGKSGDGFIWMRSMESGSHLGSFLTERGYSVGYQEGFARGGKPSMYEEVLERLPVDREVFPRSEVSLQYLLARKQVMPRQYIKDTEQKIQTTKPKDPKIQTTKPKDPKSHETQG